MLKLSTKMNQVFWEKNLENENFITAAIHRENWYFKKTNIFHYFPSKNLKYSQIFLSETIHAQENGSRGPHFAKSLNSNFLKGLTYSAMAGGSRRAGRALRRRSQRQLFCNILSINALITVVAVAITPNIKMSVWFLCSCEAAINNARIVAATIIYCSEANRLIWKNEGCLQPDVDVKVKLKWGWSLNAAQTEYRSGRRLLECLPGKIKQECPNNNAAHRSIINMIRKYH